ncbi:hypothetical protein [Natronomonas marina]|uniref:hypothetical protein n=1 Tax=Natronomonas marina TaxID=2961939 RepID=UPI0020C963E3|nr:hypothetical protein [Natronomonas marina]
MADDEREAERTVERSADSGADAERAADAFLDLEGELSADDPPPEGPRSGLVVDAETVPAGEVPASSPLDATTDSVLALTLETADGRAVTDYFEWPDDGGVDPESRLGRLLAAANVPADGFADLYGRRLPLERADGRWRAFVPRERPRGAGDWSLGVAGGLVFNAAVLGLVALGAAGTPVGGLLSALTIPYFLVNLLVLPYATYRDATYLRSHSDWGQGPPFWATLSMVPVLNVLVSALYLRSRSKARFLGEEPSLSTRLVRRVRDLR